MDLRLQTDREPEFALGIGPGEKGFGSRLWLLLRLIELINPLPEWCNEGE
jgi:hypothetical protein